MIVPQTRGAVANLINAQPTLEERRAYAFRLACHYAQLRAEVVGQLKTLFDRELAGGFVRLTDYGIPATEVNELMKDIGFPAYEFRGALLSTGNMNSRRQATKHAVAFAADIYGVGTEDIMGRRSFKRHIEARQACWVVLNELYGWGTSELGRLFNRDHSTIHHGLRAVPERVAKSSEAASDLQKLRAACGVNRR